MFFTIIAIISIKKTVENKHVESKGEVYYYQNVVSKIKKELGNLVRNKMFFGYRRSKRVSHYTASSFLGIRASEIPAG